MGRKEQNIALQTSAEVFVLNQDVYDQVRDEVNQKLSNRVKHFISNINLQMDLVQTRYEELDVIAYISYSGYNLQIDYG